MCSYQRINDTYACNNEKTQNGILKGELGFQVGAIAKQSNELLMPQGFVVSDWGALYGGIEYAEHGLDMGMPDASSWGNTLVQSIKNGSFPESRVTDMATRSD